MNSLHCWFWAPWSAAQELGFALFVLGAIFVVFFSIGSLLDKLGMFHYLSDAPFGIAALSTLFLLSAALLYFGSTPTCAS